MAACMAALLAIALAACGGGNSGAAGADSSSAASGNGATAAMTGIQFPSGSAGGSFYQVAGLIANELEPVLDIPVVVMPSGGSGENLNLIEKGEAQLGLVAANNLWPAYNGTLQYEGKQYKNFRLIAQLYRNPVVYYSLEKSGISTIQDFKGKRIGAGASPAAWGYISQSMIEAHGLDFAKDVKPVYVGFGDAANQIGDGLLDATISNVGMPAIQQVASQNALNYIQLDDAAMDQ